MKEPLPPPRLVDEAGPLGDWLRRTLSEERPERSVPRFAALQERRALRGRARLAWGAALVTASAVATWSFARRSVEAPLVARAEPLLAAPSLPQPTHSEVAKELENAGTSTKPEDAARVARGLGSERRRPRLGEEPRTRLAATPTIEAPAAVRPPRSARDCAALARGGSVDDAMSCYGEMASGSGVTAELSLFEQARLAGKVLRQPSRALALLDEHQRRFPGGSLRAEVQLARIDWLLALGDKAAARDAVQDALNSGLLREREPELLRLRDSLPAPKSAGAAAPSSP